MSKINKILIIIICILTVIFVFIMFLFLKDNRKEISDVSNDIEELDDVRIADTLEEINEITNDENNEEVKEDDGRVEVKSDEELEEISDEFVYDPNWFDPNSVEDDEISEENILVDKDVDSMIMWYLMSPVAEEGSEFYTEDLINKREQLVQEYPFNELDGKTIYGETSFDLDNKTATLECLETNKTYTFGFSANEDGTKLSDLTFISDNTQQQESSTEEAQQEPSLEESITEE